MKLNALREQRSAKVAAMKNLVDKAGAESRDLSADEIKQFDTLKAEERGLGEQIERAEYLQEIERRSAGSPVSGNPSADFDKLAGSVSVVKVGMKEGWVWQLGAEVRQESSKTATVFCGGLQEEVAVFGGASTHEKPKVLNETPKVLRENVSTFGDCEHVGYVAPQFEDGPIGPEEEGF